jgi:hypothetical protein
VATTSTGTCIKTAYPLVLLINHIHESLSHSCVGRLARPRLNTQITQLAMTRTTNNAEGADASTHRSREQCTDNEFNRLVSVRSYEQGHGGSMFDGTSASYTTIGPRVEDVHTTGTSVRTQQTAATTGSEQHGNGGKE